MSSSFPTLSCSALPPSASPRLLGSVLESWIESTPPEYREICRAAAEEVNEFVIQRQKFSLNHGLESIPSDLFRITAFAQGLHVLDLSKNALRVLPSTIQSLTALEDLNLESNQLKTLPTELRFLIHLKKLNCHNNQLTTVFPEIKTLSSLKTLIFSRNLLTTIPPTIGSLTALEKLSLDHNPIRAFPTEIKKLPSCVISLIGNNALSDSVAPRLCRQQSSPRVFISEFPSVFGRNCPIETFLTALHTSAQLSENYLTDLKYERFLADPELETRLQHWFFKLFKYADFKSQDEKTSKLAQRILHLLMRAYKQDDFRPVFRRVVLNSTPKWGNRVALSLLDVEVEYQLAGWNKQDLPGLCGVLTRVVFVPEILQTIVKEQERARRLEQARFAGLMRCAHPGSFCP